MTQPCLDPANEPANLDAFAPASLLIHGITTPHTNRPAFGAKNGGPSRSRRRFQCIPMRRAQPAACYHLRSYLLRSQMAVAFMPSRNTSSTMMPAAVRSEKARCESEAQVNIWAGSTVAALLKPSGASGM